MTSAMAPVSHNRRRSRSDSTSSSVVTVKRTAPISSRPEPRGSFLKARATSPDPPTPVLGSLLTPNRDRSRPESAGGSNPNLNINRWSHSTTSSVGAVDTEAVRQKANSSARRMSIGPALNPPPGVARPLEDNRVNVQAAPSIKSPSRKPKVRTGHLVDTTFNFLHPEPSSQASSAKTTPQATPTSMFNLATADYFGETWDHRTLSNKAGEPVATAFHYITSAPPIRKEQDVNHGNVRSLHHQIAHGQQHDAVDAVDIATVDSASLQSKASYGRGHRSPTQKTMLSKALAKANTAVLLDNAQNIEGAIEAYAEACELLQQVMVRSSDMDDRKKLSAIRSTYSNRIAELHDLDDSFSSLMEKALPEDPPIDHVNHAFFSADGNSIGPTTAEVLEQVQIPQRQESLLPQIFGGNTYLEDPGAPTRRMPAPVSTLAVPMDSKYMPPPLSPRRPPSPTSTMETETPVATVPPASTLQHSRDDSAESTSWLNDFDDAESSTASSRLSSISLEPKGTGDLGNDIEAEIDAALMDAAYDDDAGQDDTPRRPENQEHANELVEPIRMAATELKKGRVPEQDADTDSNLTREYDDSGDEEERLLEEMTQGFVFDDFHFDKQSKSALPRQSDSSTFSGRTWASSVPSTAISNGTTLSTLAEAIEAPSPQKSSVNRDARSPAVPIDAPAATTLQPTLQNTRPPSFDRHLGSGLRDRRLSGQSARQLKIETFARRSSTSHQSSEGPPILPLIEIPATDDHSNDPSAGLLSAIERSRSTSTGPTQPLTPLTSTHSAGSVKSESPATPALTQGGSQGSIDDSLIAPASPARAGRMMPPTAPIKKNVSSQSLRSRNLSLANSETAESPSTPNSAVFPAELKKLAPPLPTPVSSTFGVHSIQAGGMYLFDDQIGTPTSPETPRSPSNSSSAGPPASLEPCPDSFLLRPFWLMRSLYQTIAHPRGGYLSTKLFIPRDIWRVKNVKLKALDDKVSQCDFLTAALMKLSKVDTLDAGALLVELQSFETVLDQVRAALQKKLGSDVGVTTSSNIFRSPGTDEISDPLASKSNNGTTSAAKSFASSWRKLRSKSSSATMNNPMDRSGKEFSSMNSNAGLSMSSLPMTSSRSIPSSRSHNPHSPRHRSGIPPPTPTSLTNIPFSHAQYMSSLARLFDAAQVLDSVARQVEDPGLKYSSQTHVGLELSVRNAAEFFAFYIVRFVMGDISVLVDKFLKRGSEWVLA